MSDTKFKKKRKKKRIAPDNHNGMLLNSKMEDTMYTLCIGPRNVNVNNTRSHTIQALLFNGAHQILSVMV